MGLLIQNVSRCDSVPAGIMETLESDGLDTVKKEPLLRARTCLDTALHLLKEGGWTDENGLASIQLAMAYVLLELRDFGRALKMAQAVIGVDTSNSDTAFKSHYQLQKIATARMYASEASCAMGDAPGGMRFLVGDGQDDAFDRLASELGGVTILVAANNVKGKARLARAQSMVRSSASAASAVLGNLTHARQLAMSAQAMEDASSTPRANSTARRALVYCMLREGNCGAAMSLLKSLT
jgi:hypothetical protein